MVGVWLADHAVDGDAARVVGGGVGSLPGSADPAYGCRADHLSRL